MTTPIDYKSIIKSDLTKNIPKSEITRKIYLSFPTHALKDIPEREFELKNKISKKFEVNIYSIHFGGSGKTGESFHKVNKFTPGKSDLDAAIIDQKLFTTYLEFSCEVTDGFRDLSKFGNRIQDSEVFMKYLKRGILIPEMMPSGFYRKNWIDFFNNLSADFTDVFDNVNCWIYSSQKIFELKFKKTIDLLG